MESLSVWRMVLPIKQAWVEVTPQLWQAALGTGRVLDFKVEMSLSQMFKQNPLIKLGFVGYFVKEMVPGFALAGLSVSNKKGNK